MKRLQKILALFLVLAAVSSVASCSNATESPETNSPAGTASTTTQVTRNAIWNNAKYLEDTELGEGEKTFTVVVEALGSSVKLTVHSNEENLGSALINLGVIEGSEGPYGIMVEKVNGMQAIYDTDKAYWSLSINGEYAMSGADTTPINNGDSFTWTYTKG